MKFLKKLFAAKKYYKWTLEKDFEFDVPFDLGKEVEYYQDLKGNLWLITQGKKCIVKARYSWDGCSPKYKVNGKVYGVWDGPVVFHPEARDTDQQLKYASLVHDVLCQFRDHLPDNVDQDMVDKLFYEDCKASGFKAAEVYYKAVRWYQKNIVKSY